MFPLLVAWIIIGGAWYALKKGKIGVGMYLALAVFALVLQCFLIWGV